MAVYKSSERLIDLETIAQITKQRVNVPDEIYPGLLDVYRFNLILEPRTWNGMKRLVEFPESLRLWYFVHTGEHVDTISIVNALEVLQEKISKEEQEGWAMSEKPIIFGSLCATPHELIEIFGRPE